MDRIYTTETTEKIGEKVLLKGWVHARRDMGKIVFFDLRKYGSVPSSGFGVGLERLVAWICGIKHVRETIPFPRLINRKTP